VNSSTGSTILSQCLVHAEHEILIFLYFKLSAPQILFLIFLLIEGMASLTPEAQEIFGAKYDPADELWLRVFFTPSERSQAAGRKYLERQRARKQNRDPLPNEKVAPAQAAETVVCSVSRVSPGM
jgi:hypothetical protein